jgi:hypothetical protein
MKVTLSKPVSCKKTVVGEVTEAEIVSFTDDSINQRVTCVCRLGSQRQSILLWEKEAYAAAGQYTDTMVAARLDELLTAELPPA